ALLRSQMEFTLETRDMPGETLMGILATAWAIPQRSDPAPEPAPVDSYRSSLSSASGIPHGPTNEDAFRTSGIDTNWILSLGKDSADSLTTTTDQDRIGDWGAADSDEKSFDPLRATED